MEDRPTTLFESIFTCTLLLLNHLSSDCPWVAQLSVLVASYGSVVKDDRRLLETFRSLILIAFSYLRMDWHCQDRLIQSTADQGRLNTASLGRGCLLFLWNYSWHAFHGELWTETWVMLRSDHGFRNGNHRLRLGWGLRGLDIWAKFADSIFDLIENIRV